MDVSADFITLYESFNLVQSVTTPTHLKGHTLDLILSFGFPVHNVTVSDFPPSDHKSVSFHILLPYPGSKPPSSSRSRIFNANSAARFKTAFLAAPPVAVQPQPSVNDLVNHFNSNSLRILDNIAPFKTKHKKPSTLKWLNDHTNEMKRQCRKAERKWKKDRLATSHNILKEAMTAYLSVCCQRGEKCLFFKHYKYKC